MPEITMNNRFAMNLLGLVIAVGAILLFGKMYFYTIHGDDPWFAEQAYWLVKDGVVRSEFFSSLLDYGTQQFAYHKLHIWIAALAIKLFGLSFLSLKFITLSFFCGFLLVARKYFYIFHAERAKEYFIVFLAFILINSIVLEMVFIYRPEIAIMCLGFISYYLLRTSLEKGVKYSLLSGVFAGLCTLMHLNGIIFIAAGAVLLLANKKIKYTFWFSVAALVVASLYFVDILPNHWATYWMQFRHDPAIPDSQFSLQSLLLQIVFEYERFFGHGYESGYSLMLLVVLVLNGKSFWKHTELRHCLIYFFVLTFVLAAISPGKKHYYLLFGLPYAGILISTSLWQALTHVKRSGKDKVLVGFAVLYVLANVPHALAIINDGRADVVTPRENVEVMRQFQIHNGDKVLAPLDFVFNAVEKVNIHGVEAYLIRAKWGKVELSATGLFREARSTDRQFILLEHRQTQALKLVPVIGDEIDGYTFLGAMHGYDVFKEAVPKQ